MSDKKLSKKRPRFTKGKLVMLSRKNTKSGSIPYIDPSSKRQRIVGHLDRGIPIFLVEEPEFSPSKNLMEEYFWVSSLREQNVWKITFLLKEKLYVMPLTNKQYNHELVKAVPRRLNKNYQAKS